MATKGPHERHPCPGCGERFGNLPQHIVSCDDIPTTEEVIDHE